ncbi:MAG: glycosyltransferase family 1 protein [bacterium]|nr:glycosyltransferase family 1 protein [bacterium]
MILIGVDGNEANQDTRVGIGRYAMELLWQFYNFQIPNIKLQIYLKDQPRGHMPKEKDGWEYKIVGPRAFWTQIGLPIDLFLDKNRPDIFWTPTHYAPRFCPVPSIVSIMDTSYLHYPEMFKKRDLYQLTSWSKYSINNAAMVLTISKAARADIIKFYNVDPTKVVVTYPGIVMNKNILTNKVLAKYGIKPNFILYVGTLQPRKNLVRLIEAFGLLENKTLQLVIVGKKGWLFDEIFTKVNELGLEDRVIFTGFVPDEELSSFYQEAKLITLVSLYEGFGLPPLEAMSYGTPAVVSNVSSLPEIVGEAGILVNPEDSSDIASGITKALTMSDSAYNKQRELAKAQAAKFNWSDTARETLQVLQSVVGNI